MRTKTVCQGLLRRHKNTDGDRCEKTEMVWMQRTNTEVSSTVHECEGHRQKT